MQRANKERVEHPRATSACCTPTTYSLPLMAAAQASERGVTRQNSVGDVGHESSLSSYTQEHACVHVACVLPAVWLLRKLQQCYNHL